MHSSEMRSPATVGLFATNPFVLTHTERLSSISTLEALSLPRLVAEALEQEDLVAAEEAILALGMLAIARDPSAKLQLPERHVVRLPKALSDYQRVAAAAARAYDSIRQIVGGSPAMARVRQEVWAACFGDSLRCVLHLESVIIDHDVLILGETGTGKEAVASAIQTGLPGDEHGGPAPSSALNAAAVPETLLESELFGHVKGAFTGALESRQGMIRRARGGCFFLDEVGDLRESTQVKLLRVMETNLVSPLGADEGERADCRYVAATHKDIEAMVERGEFRRDFYQRLAGLVITLPALRDHTEDIPVIGERFLERYEVPDDVRERALAWLQKASRLSYAWPGNVRELQNRLRSVMLGLASPLGRTAAVAQTGSALPSSFESCAASMKDVENWYLAKVLAKVDNNYAAASRILHMDRATIRRRAAQLE
ncbi:MAG: DNA-binding NtrC family response regulator [Polyangiales bacterium]|jgi:DNA-binding NtrC family response regulator